MLYPTAKESDWIILLYSTGGPPVLDYGQAGSISPAAAVAKKAAVCVTGLGDCDAADRASSACLLLPLQARKISSALVLVCFVCSCGSRKVALARAKSVSVSSASNDKQTCLASRSWSDCLERWNRFLFFPTLIERNFVARWLPWARVLLVLLTGIHEAQAVYLQIAFRCAVWEERWDFLGTTSSVPVGGNAVMHRDFF